MMMEEVEAQGRTSSREAKAVGVADARVLAGARSMVDSRAREVTVGRGCEDEGRGGCRLLAGERELARSLG